MRARDAVADIKAFVIESWALSSARFERRIGTPHYSLPNLDELDWHCIGDPSAQNFVVAEKSVDWHKDRQLIFGPTARNCVLMFGKGCRAKGRFSLHGKGQLAIYGEDSVRAGTANTAITGTNNFLFVGKQTECIAANFFLNGIGSSIVMGDGCLTSHGVFLRNNDDHAIISLSTGEWINSPEDIVVEPSVWLCPEVHILKGTTVGFGSVIASRSTVTSPVPRFALAGGVPARVLREGITWNRPLEPAPNLAARMLSRVEQLTPI